MPSPLLLPPQPLYTIIRILLVTIIVVIISTTTTTTLEISLRLSCEHDAFKIKSEWNGHRPQLSRLNNDTHATIDTFHLFSANCRVGRNCLYDVLFAMRWKRPSRGWIQLSAVNKPLPESLVHAAVNTITLLLVWALGSNWGIVDCSGCRGWRGERTNGCLTVLDLFWCWRRVWRRGRRSYLATSSEKKLDMTDASQLATGRERWREPIPAAQMSPRDFDASFTYPR